MDPGMNESLRRLFLREKPVLALMAVGETEAAYAALVAKRIDSTVPHTCSILSQMEAEGLISSRPVGRINYLELTARGKSLALALRELLDNLEEPDEMRLRLERLRQMVSQGDGRAAALSLGPLRRDLAIIMDQGDRSLQDEARELDGIISSLVNG